MCVRAIVHMGVHACVNVCVCMCVRVHASVCIQVCVQVCVSVCTSMRVAMRSVWCVCVRAHIIYLFVYILQNMNHDAGYPSFF